MTSSQFQTLLTVHKYLTFRSLDDLKRTAENSTYFDTALSTAAKRERDVAIKTEAMRVLHRNLGQRTFFALCSLFFIQHYGVLLSKKDYTLTVRFIASLIAVVIAYLQ